MQHVDWVNQLHPEEGARAELDRIQRREHKLSYAKRGDTRSLMWDRMKLDYLHGKGDGLLGTDGDDLKLKLRKALAVEHSGPTNSLSIPEFGTINVIHGDILDKQNFRTAILVPLPPNLMPNRGLGQYVLDLGGQDLIREVAANVRTLIGSIPTTGVPVGTLVPTASKKTLMDNCAVIFFVVMPYFWQGTATDANNRFRYSFKKALKEIADIDQIDCITIPHLGRGLYGYDSHRSSEILVEESLLALMKIESSSISKPYSLKTIDFVDSDISACESLSSALDELAERFIPAQRVVTAEQYWSRSDRKIIGMHETMELSRMRKADKIKFRKYHGLIRHFREHYRRNLRPFIWRKQVVNTPPSLRVRKLTGAHLPLDRQAAPNPFYRHGLKYDLFPRPRGSLAYRKLVRNGKGILKAQKQKNAFKRRHEPFNISQSGTTA